jgi:NAD(P)-dependent dehydrogenase (short-subunit alcohol dehydrogenase family)
MDTTNLKGKTAVVTGAASGIGRATALLLAQRGANVCICDLNEPGLAETERLAQALGSNVLSRPVDVAKRDEMEQFAAAVHATVPAVDIVVNNAGVGLGASFLDTSLEDWDWIININLYGVIYGCHFFVPPMIQRGLHGHVVNVSSAAGYVATEALCAYSTTKFGVFGLSEALRDELTRYQIGVTAVCPGLINTPITRTSRLRGAAMNESARQRMVDLYERRNYSPERVAENILKAIHRNRAVAPISPEAWFMYVMKRLSPGLVGWINRTIGERARREMQQSTRSAPQ